MPASLTLFHSLALSPSLHSLSNPLSRAHFPIPSPSLSLSRAHFPIAGRGVEVRRAADGPGAQWRVYASQTSAAEACKLDAGALSAYLNGWSGKATGEEPINGWLLRRSGVIGVKRPRDGEGEGDGDGGSADGEGEDDDGTMTPQDEGDIEIMDKKEEESKEGKRDADSLDAEDDNGDARPAGRLDPATLNGHTLPQLKLMCRQVRDDVTYGSGVLPTKKQLSRDAPGAQNQGWRHQGRTRRTPRRAHARRRRRDGYTGGRGGWGVACRRTQRGGIIAFGCEP